VALVGHATGEWEEGGEGVQGAEKNSGTLQVGRGGRRLTRGHDNIPYIYLVYRRKCTYIGCLGGDQHHV
jgi:hypothetical protein